MNIHYLRSIFLPLLIVLITACFTTRGIEAQGFETGREVNIPPPSMEELLSVNEKFVYNVTYGFFTLGKIYVETVYDTTFQGKECFYLETEIRSNHSIPLIGREINRYGSFVEVADSLPRTLQFQFDNVDEDIMQETRYFFDRDSRQVFTFEMGEPVDTLELEEPASSGHIVFYLSRLFAGTVKPYDIPIYINHEKGGLRAESDPHVEMRKYEAFDKPIPVYRAEGYADVDGPFGFSGRFISFFSADKWRIPLEGNVKVWLGYAKVRLIKYSREPINTNK